MLSNHDLLDMWAALVAEQAAARAELLRSPQELLAEAAATLYLDPLVVGLHPAIRFFEWDTVPAAVVDIAKAPADWAHLGQVWHGIWWRAWNHQADLLLKCALGSPANK